MYLKDLKIPNEKVNVNGVVTVLRHSIGASGFRIIVTLIHEMIKRDVKKGLATLCIGGGMEIAMCVEKNQYLKEFKLFFNSNFCIQNLASKFRLLLRYIIFFKKIVNMI